MEYGCGIYSLFNEIDNIPNNFNAKKENPHENREERFNDISAGLPIGEYIASWRTATRETANLSELVEFIKFSEYNVVIENWLKGKTLTCQFGMVVVYTSTKLNKILIRFNVNIEEYKRLTSGFQPFQF